MADGNAVAVTMQPVRLPSQADVEKVAFLSLIERAARDPSVDIAKMERLFEMQERAERRLAETAFNAAMAAAQAELEPVGRQSRNSHTNSSYADLATIAEQAQPIVSRHGFGLSFGTIQATLPDHIRMVCDVTHSAGHTKRYESEIPYDLAGSQGKVNKTKVQAFGSTTTYGRRYMMMLIFNIATADNDGNAPRAPRKSSAQGKRDGTDARFNEIQALFENAPDVPTLRQLSRELTDEINTMPTRWAEMLSEAWEVRLADLSAKS